MCAGAGESFVHLPRVTAPAVQSAEKQLAGGRSARASSPYPVPTTPRELASAGPLGAEGKTVFFFRLRNIDPVFLEPLDSGRVKFCNWFISAPP